MERKEQKSTPVAGSVEPDWGDVFKRLVLHGLKGLGLPIEDAKQVAQEALRRHFDPDYADWDPNKYPTLLLFLGSTMNGIVSDIRQRKGATAERPTRDGVLPWKADGAASPEQRVMDANLVRAAVSRLLVRAEHDDLVQKIIFKMLEGVDAASEQAENLRIDVKEIYKARERLKAHVAAVRADMEAN